MRRRRPPEGSLISLLDVLFILVFASLIQSHARGDAVAAPPAIAPLPPPPPVPAPVVPAPPAPLAELRKAAAGAAARHVEGAPLVIVRIAADGTVTTIERAGETRAVGIPLLRPVDDPDVKLEYLGDRTAAMRVCGVVARELRADDLAGHVVVVAPAEPRDARPTPLSYGLERDLVRCQREQHALVLIVEPDMVTP